MSSHNVTAFESNIPIFLISYSITVVRTALNRTIFQDAGAE